MKKVLIRGLKSEFVIVLSTVFLLSAWLIKEYVVERYTSRINNLERSELVYLSHLSQARILTVEALVIDPTKASHDSMVKSLVFELANINIMINEKLENMNHEVDDSFWGNPHVENSDSIVTATHKDLNSLESLFYYNNIDSMGSMNRRLSSHRENIQSDAIAKIYNTYIDYLSAKNKWSVIGFVCLALGTIGVTINKTLKYFAEHSKSADKTEAVVKNEVEKLLKAINNQKDFIKGEINRLGSREKSDTMTKGRLRQNRRKRGYGEEPDTLAKPTESPTPPEEKQ